MMEGNIGLIATGKSNLDGVTPMYLWSYGTYRYEIEVTKNSYFSESEVFESSYEEALNKFRNMVDKAILVNPPIVPGAKAL